ncbi:hypothetical protein LTR37_005765 [Vermiconidia calcicola]|uniref:Uncharacterized protein n=1 Tax=Vermiconidia calcicola TaxID=1690605 RepID=A0ACC3NJ18_9PEZI|nr:hypothetical protein LTR37_005765 [Vermiconidia calcicola]
MPGSFPVDEGSALPTLDDVEADERITRPDERGAGETTHEENDDEQPPRNEMPGAFPEDGESTVLTPNGAVADGGMVSGNNSAPPSSVEGDDTAQPRNDENQPAEPKATDCRPLLASEHAVVIPDEDRLVPLRRPLRRIQSVRPPFMRTEDHSHGAWTRPVCLPKVARVAPATPMPLPTSNSACFGDTALQPAVQPPVAAPSPAQELAPVPLETPVLPPSGFIPDPTVYYVPDRAVFQARAAATE